jgi:copper chaperone CopZ
MATAVGLGVAFVVAVGLAMLVLRARATGPRSNEARPAATPVELELAVPGMVCEGCAETIADALKAIPGVREIKPNVARKQVVVRYDAARASPGDLRGALAAAGFKAVER